MAVQEREERLRDTAESNNFRTMFFTLCKIELCVAVFGYTQVQLPPSPPRLQPYTTSQFKAVAIALKKRQR